MNLNWNKIRNEYINGHISYEKLAKKHGISIQSIKDRGTKEKWVAQKKEQQTKIQQKTNQKTAEILAEKEAERILRISAAADKLLEKIELATEQLDMYLTKDKLKYTKVAKDKKTQKPIYVDVEEENIKTVRTERINKAELKQIASALKDLRDIQFTTNEEKTTESPEINITVMAATPDDMEGEE